MGVSSSESHDLTAFYEMLTASFGVLSQNTGFYPSLDRIVETMLGPLNLGPGGGAYNEPISRLQQTLVGVVSGLDLGCMSKQQVSASGLVPNLPGRKWIQRLNWERYSNHCACQHVSFFVEVKYSRFLWSVTISIGCPEPSR